jgi:hypothetical protein
MACFMSIETPDFVIAEVLMGSPRLCRCQGTLKGNIRRSLGHNVVLAMLPQCCPSIASSISWAGGFRRFYAAEGNGLKTSIAGF